MFRSNLFFLSPRPFVTMKVFGAFGSVVLVLLGICDRGVSGPTLAETFDVRAPPGPKNCPYIPSVLPDTLPSPLPPPLTAVFDDFSKHLDSMVGKSCPSVVLTIAYKGKTIFSHGSGSISLKEEKKPDSDTIYRIGSVSKVFPVVQLYQLVNTGVVSLDDSLRNLKEDAPVLFQNYYSPGQQPTLRDLASQLSGLPREPPCDRDLICPLSNAEMYSRINGTTALITEPGAYPSYSNMAYALLGRSLAPKGMTWEEYTQKFILDRCGMNRTGFGSLNPSIDGNVAQGVAENGNPQGPYTLGWTAPCGGMHSTTKDLNALCHAIMEGTVLSKSKQSRSLANQLVAPIWINGGGNTLFGTPWEMYFHNETGLLVRRKGGNVPGYAALVTFVPDLKLSVSALWGHMGTDEFGASMYVIDSLLAPFTSMLQDMGDKGSMMQPTNQSQFVGVYTAPGIPAPMGESQVFVYNGTLLMKIGPLKISVYLRVPSPTAPKNVLQLYIPVTLAPCLPLELQALTNQFAVFGKSTVSGRFDTVEIPGYLAGLKFRLS